jgi:hypothetical protein
MGPITDCIVDCSSGNELSLGVRLKPTNRFGWFGHCEFWFLEISNRSVLPGIQNRRVRFRLNRFGFSAQPKKPKLAQKRENGRMPTGRNNLQSLHRRCAPLCSPCRGEPASPRPARGRPELPIPPRGRAAAVTPPRHS